MKIPYSWLKEYIDLTLNPPKVAKLLTLAGLEVDAIETQSLGFEKVVVGKVLEVQKHPEADKLSIALVTDGVETYQVVCGAPNCRAGIKTAFALVGATLTDQSGEKFKVKKSKIRGVESFGMLCSGRELNFSNDHVGILEFAEHLKEGADVAEIFSDSIFDISLTPNLGHCACLIGVARELSAATGVAVRLPYPQILEQSSDPIHSNVTVAVEEKLGAPRYACRLIKNIKVGPSPDWLQKRLSASGFRSVNTIVDVTNYVMMEMGHPLHAFDYDLLEGKGIIVRSANEGEKIVTLDNKERLLSQGDLLICDRVKPVAIAGVMGSANTEVNDHTVNVLLEAAYFLPTMIRKTSKRFGLQSEASKRFERGTDPNILLAALTRAASLIQQIAGGTVSEGILDIASQQFEEHTIDCRLSRINQLLGTHLGLSEVELIFQKLQLAYQWNGRDTFSLKIPTYRNDLKEEIDIIEEVARIYGYDNIAKKHYQFSPSTLPDVPLFLFEREIRAKLISEGLQEFLTCDLIGPSILKIISEEMPQDVLIKIINPTSSEQSILRTSLLPGFLQTVKFNWDHQNPNIAGFEIGRIHFKEEDQFKEQTVAGIILSGKSMPHHWDEKPREFDFFDIKGILENILSELKLEEKITFKESQLSSLHPGKQAAIFVGSLEVGFLGEVHPSIVRRLDVPQRLFFAEINLHDLFKVLKKEQKFQSIPIYPGSERDWTVTLKANTPIYSIIEAIDALHSRLLEKVSLLYLYESEKLGKGVKNATFRFAYRDVKKTIAQEKVDGEHSRIINEVTKFITNNNFG